MSSPARSLSKALVELLLVGALVFALDWLALAFTRESSPVSALWLGNGLLVGVVLTAPRGRWVGLLLSGGAATLGSYLLVGDPGWFSWRISAYNLLEVLVAVLPLRQGVTELDALLRPRPLWVFAGVGVLLAPLVASLAVAADGHLTQGINVLGLQRGWFLGHAIGMAAVAPLTAALRLERWSTLLRPQHRVALLCWLAVVALVGVVVSSQDRAPLAFLLFPPLLLASLRGGLIGASLGILIVLAISIGFPAAGFSPSGPLLLPPLPLERFLVPQLFVASLLLSLFPLAAAFAGRTRGLTAAEAVRNRLRLLAEHSSDVIVLTDARNRREYVSPAVREVLGWTEEEFLQQSLVDLVLPEDWERVSALQADEADWQRQTQVFRARRKDGQIIWLETLTSRFREAGQEGRVISLRDITRRRQAELSLERANTELASLVWKDGLTGLANRRRFDEALANEWQQGLRSGFPLAVLMIDVDHFKLFNDRHGHQGGDRCLQTVAATIAESLYRDADLAARYGGEEFGVILPQTPVDDAARVAERIRQNLTTTLLEHPDSPYGMLTVSVGVAGAVPRVGGSVHDLVRAADEALYTSKREGRNRTTVLEVNWQ